jgi:hypothetical protein
VGLILTEFRSAWEGGFGGFLEVCAPVRTT